MPAEANPVVSVCIASYNGEKYIEEQLRSILDSPRVDEVLVSDDGSTDATVDIAASIGDPRVRILAGPRRGLIRNFESVIAQARGRYIFLADQDDVWLPGKVDACVSALAHVDLVVTDCRVVDEHLKVLKRSYFEARPPRKGLLGNLLVNSYLGCCMAFRREVADRALPFPAGTPMHDWWIGLVAAMFGSVRFIDEPLVLYRRHGTNASVTTERSRFPLSRRLGWRLGLVQQLVLRRFAVPARLRSAS